MRRSKLKKIKACSTKNLRARTRIKFNLGLYYLISLPRLLFQAMFDNDNAMTTFQSRRKATPKNAQTTPQLHSSHMLVK